MSSDQGPEQLREAHRAMAAALADSSEASPVEVARHWLAAGDLVAFSQWAVRAAEVARRDGAYAAEAEMLRGVLDAWTVDGVPGAAGASRASLALQAARAMRMAGEPF